MSKCCYINDTMNILHKRCLMVIYRTIHPKLFCKKGVVRNFTKFTAKYMCQSLFLAQVFSCEFCGISKNSFSHRTPLVAASAFKMKIP